jgi:hypothetical protein
MMRIRALTGIASAGILAVTVGVETANAQSYRCYGATRTCTPQPYPPQSRGSIPRGGPRTVPFSDPNIRKPQEVIILVTIMACLMVETDDRQWARHIRDHRNGENGKKSRRPYAPGRSVCATASPDPELDAAPRAGARLRHDA